MFKLIVERWENGEIAQVEASSRQALIDQLEAAAGQYRFEVMWNEPRVEGFVCRAGVEVGFWEIEEVV